jgi:hypothetical protein
MARARAALIHQHATKDRDAAIAAGLSASSSRPASTSAHRSQSPAVA